MSNVLRHLVAAALDDMVAAPDWGATSVKVTLSPANWDTTSVGLDKGGHVPDSPYRQRPGDQPLPVEVPGEVSSHQWVINDLAMRGVAPGVFGAASARINARERLGIERYGQLLQPGNGRDVMRDVWEETIDQVVYLATAVREGHPVHGLYDRAVGVMLEVITYMDASNQS